MTSVTPNQEVDDDAASAWLGSGVRGVACRLGKEGAHPEFRLEVDTEAGTLRFIGRFNAFRDARRMCRSGEIPTADGVFPATLAKSKFGIGLQADELRDRAEGLARFFGPVFASYASLPEPKQRVLSRMFPGLVPVTSTTPLLVREALRGPKRVIVELDASKAHPAYTLRVSAARDLVVRDARFAQFQAICDRVAKLKKTSELSLPAFPKRHKTQKLGLKLAASRLEERRAMLETYFAALLDALDSLAATEGGNEVDAVLALLPFEEDELDEQQQQQQQQRQREEHEAPVEDDPAPPQAAAAAAEVTPPRAAAAAEVAPPPAAAVTPPPPPEATPTQATAEATPPREAAAGQAETPPPRVVVASQEEKKTKEADDEEKEAADTVVKRSGLLLGSRKQNAVDVLRLSTMLNNAQPAELVLVFLLAKVTNVPEQTSSFYVSSSPAWYVTARVLDGDEDDEPTAGTERSGTVDAAEELDEIRWEPAVPMMFMCKDSNWKHRKLLVSLYDRNLAATTTTADEEPEDPDDPDALVSYGIVSSLREYLKAADGEPTFTRIECQLVDADNHATGVLAHGDVTVMTMEQALAYTSVRTCAVVRFEKYVGLFDADYFCSGSRCVDAIACWGENDDDDDPSGKKSPAAIRVPGETLPPPRSDPWQVVGFVTARDYAKPYEDATIAIKTQGGLVVAPSMDVVAPLEPGETVVEPWAMHYIPYQQDEQGFQYAGTLDADAWVARAPPASSTLVGELLFGPGARFRRSVWYRVTREGGIGGNRRVASLRRSQLFAPDPRGIDQARRGLVSRARSLARFNMSQRNRIKTSKKLALADEIIAAALKLAAVDRDDVVFDMGCCGDGRFPMAAVSDPYDASIAMSILVDDVLFDRATANVARAGLGDKIKLMRAREMPTFDAPEFKALLAGATLLAVYVQPEALKLLEPLFLEFLNTPVDDDKKKRLLCLGWGPVALRPIRVDKLRVLEPGRDADARQTGLDAFLFDATSVPTPRTTYWRRRSSSRRPSLVPLTPQRKILKQQQQQQQQQSVEPQPPNIDTPPQPSPLPPPETDAALDVRKLTLLAQTETVVAAEDEVEPVKAL